MKSEVFDTLGEMEKWILDNPNYRVMFIQPRIGESEYIAYYHVINNRVEELERVLARVLPLFEEYVSEMGTCDHWVGICLCGDRSVLEELKSVLGKE